jgi:hypothetical protein
MFDPVPIFSSIVLEMVVVGDSAEFDIGRVGDHPPCTHAAYVRGYRNSFAGTFTYPYMRLALSN